MSLTNDMLNNLEKRHSLTSDHQSVFSGIEAIGSSKSDYLNFCLYASCAFFLLSTAIDCLYIKSHHHLFSVNDTAPKIIKIPLMHFDVPSKTQEKLAPQNSSSQATPVITPVTESIQDQATRAYEQALAFISQNQFSDAIEKLKSIINMAPDYQDARTTLATLYLENNQLSDAKQLLTDGLEKEPANFPLTLLLARVLFMEGHNQAALSALKNISNVAGNNSDYFDLLASVQEALGNYSEAIMLYRSLLAQDPANSRWLVSLGTAFEHVGQNNAALNAYKKANSLGQLPLDLENYVANRIHDLEN